MIATHVPGEKVDIVFNIPKVTLLPGQYHLSADNAKPGLIILAYDVADHDEWTVEEQPVQSFIAVYDENASSDGGSVHEDSVTGETNDGVNNTQEVQSGEADENAQAEELGTDNRSVREEVKHLFRRLYVVTGVFNDIYLSMRIATHNETSLDLATEEPKWRERHIPLINDNTSDEEEKTLDQAFGERVTPLRVRKMYGGAALQQPCAVHFQVCSSRHVDPSGTAIVVGDLEAEGYNDMVQKSWEKFGPQGMPLNSGS